MAVSLAGPRQAPRSAVRPDLRRRRINGGCVVTIVGFPCVSRTQWMARSGDTSICWRQGLRPLGLLPHPRSLFAEKKTRCRRGFAAGCELEVRARGGPREGERPGLGQRSAPAFGGRSGWGRFSPSARSAFHRRTSERGESILVRFLYAVM